MNFDETVAHLLVTWGKKTLCDFREEAEREFNGTVFDGLRMPDGTRPMLAMCLTGDHQISLLERVMDLSDSFTREDWTLMTLADLLSAAASGAGVCVKSIRGDNGRPSAVVLMAADPRSISILEKLFGLRP